jgi:hypothetical protein
MNAEIRVAAAKQKNAPKNTEARALGTLLHPSGAGGARKEIDAMIGSAGSARKWKSGGNRAFLVDGKNALEVGISYPGHECLDSSRVCVPKQIAPPFDPLMQDGAFH